ncbi:MAG: hypothetical protein Q4G25_07420, partial [Paracoccus sp. (in: a-proteobacteria)]|nr:hypothetical protein [Paracoccus sp. (in: a-proteobacteria)]
MAGWNDDDKTDHGMGQGGGSPFGQPPAQPHPPGPGDDRTVIGGALSPQGQPRGPQGGGHHGLGQPPAAPAYPAPGQAGGYGAPQGGAWPQAGAPAGQSSGGTWVGAPGSAAGYQPGGTGYQPPAYQPPPF